MKKVLLVVLFILFMFNGCFDEKEKKDVSKVTSKNSIAIGKFQLKGNTTQSQYADLLSDFRSYIDDSFSKNSDFKTVNKERVDEILATNGLYEEIKIKKRGTKVSINAIKKYKEANAQYVLLGEIRNFSLDKLRGSKINNGTISTISKKQLVLDSYVSISLIHVATQEIVAKENLKIKKLIEDDSNSDTLISTALEILSDEIVSKLLLSISGDIKVISVQDNEVVINKGSQNGIKKDMLFDIYSEEIIDTFKTQRKVSTVKIVRVDKKISFATLQNIIKLPTSGNIAKLKEVKREEFVKERIRIAIGETLILQDNIKETKNLRNYISNELEYLFSQNTNFVVTNNDASQTDKILAQQLLDELSKGREIGLPLGSLRGVDYLVFTTIDYVHYQGKKVTQEYIDSLDIKIRKVKNAKASISGFVYLIDVNTGNKIASVPLNIEHDFKDAKYASAMIKTLAKKFSFEATKKIFNKITPLRVIKLISNQKVMLNSGKNIGLKLEDILNVYSKEERITDEYTGVDKTISGYKIAKLKVVDFNASGEAIANVISGVINKTGNHVMLEEKKSNKNISSSNDKLENKMIREKKDSKKYIIIKDTIFSSDIKKYKHKYISNKNISNKIREVINKSKIFRILSRDKSQIKAIMEEKQIANSDISDDYSKDSMRLSLADFIVIPKITKLSMYKTSKQIANIESYENKEFIEVGVSLMLMNTKGEVIYDNSKSDKYFRAWASDNKLKSTIPARSKIDSLSNKLIEKMVNNFISNKSDILSDGLLTIVDVGKTTISFDLASNKVEVGDVFYVYPKPKMKTIERTGKRRLVYGSRVGKVKVDVIFDGMAEAVIINGDIKDIKENFILRN